MSKEKKAAEFLKRHILMGKPQKEPLKLPNPSFQDETVARAAAYIKKLLKE